AAVPELRRARLVLTWLAGFVLGVAPLAVPALALAAHGIDYPFLSFAGEPGQGAAGASPRLAARIASLLTALASTPLRVAATTTLPIALLGALGLAIAARRDHAARAVAVASIALVAFLAPVHFEARYLLFVIPPLAVVAVLVVVRACARAGLRARTAHAIVLAGAATLALLQASIVRDDEAQAARTEADARVLCAALTTRAATETPLVVGLDRGTGGAPERWGHVYTRLRDCPRPTIHDPAILVVDALPNDHGLALHIVAADQGAGLAVRAEGPRDRTRPEGQVPPRPGNGEPQIGPEGQVSPRPGDGEPPLGPEGRGVPPRPSGGEPLLGGHVEPPSPGDGEPLLALELPVRPSSSRCVRRVVDAPAGEGTLVARLGSTPPHVAQLTVRTSSVALRVVAAGLPARAVHAPLVVGRRRRVELELCAADPLRAVGAVVLDGLAIIPSSAPTPIE
ncbi:hypothetical protein L6R52_30790, partial [Myxococcota bacterium]|nr:hypothetical protein [Myxococcota bacterium]